MELEPRGWRIRANCTEQLKKIKEESERRAKPNDIDKRIVYEAYKKVKANGGSAGIDNVKMEAFEKNLKGNLYKLWNRMSSGSYFPKPVKLVEIPKGNGGKRPLGIPKLLSYYMSSQFVLGMFSTNWDCTRKECPWDPDKKGCYNCTFLKIESYHNPKQYGRGLNMEHVC